MCGIVGYIGNNEKKSLLLNGLKELEYRGYDSAGISVLENGELHTFKAVGKLVNLEHKCENFKSSGFGLGIGHTRWATHGKPTEINAHPHIGHYSNVVHNGIIENYQSIKESLQKQGYVFTSQTDTEAIVHLFESYVAQTNDPFSAFKKTIADLKGAYAILLITQKSPNTIYYAKNGSPLIIGKNTDETEIFFASSDAPLIGLASEVAYLEDGEVGKMELGSFHTLSNTKPLNGDKLSAQKDGFTFFMEKEIYEQHKVLLETMMGRVSEKGFHLDELEALNLDSFSSITLCACGTSYHASLAGSYLLERIAKLKTKVEIASEFRYKEPILHKDELFIVISQSGETADTLEALKLAKKSGLKTLGICNVDNSSIVRESDYSLLTRAGIEKGVASTKAFATQVMLLWILANFLAQKRGILNEESIKNEANTMLEASRATKVDKKLHEHIKRLSRRYLHGHGFFFIGRDIFYPLALEGALKLKEISYLHAEGYPSGEMKHGPIALADLGLFCVALMPQNLLHDKIKSNVEELSAREAMICALSAEHYEGCDDWIKIPHYPHYMVEFFSMMVVLQIFALEVAVRLGNDVDMPRNLAKSVTVE
ncbi:glutamine--fructose-6-phosphate transaminase (isomerizing) [Helicobacter winghamensis]|uniref:Glutamine--fructose-6-phosphate aminotransferase [isomerizing] n=1 Tax=Helicobacter winghamensis TaxID=157268 RepID=A0A2N3PHY1_9HELI|nr:glutamine--fructose-6-phosphate transaminase (isomerizing) [Helicobacter winghamensis]EEO25574.1 glutamine-fructose-6-phosphate transaminase (isomerizing) [Helicobacter winghamensis ATCC BAA-430]PKT78016.1 glutamine--fructose-6-phosphate aminotransferase [Helicobacter winghamensis]PKT78279.1 glutamine--fructose-6-phosphate aminotransferase [Helicobacter winghamensis]PKT78544.1 glutamine--fructose-6-phosphate aminotransferase [Helicobacter winghamensis]PKT80127.1 glutamine--fructose-6-phosph